jgi:hypothetical protein
VFLGRLISVDASRASRGRHGLTRHPWTNRHAFVTPAGPETANPQGQSLAGSAGVGAALRQLTSDLSTEIAPATAKRAA